MQVTPPHTPPPAATRTNAQLNLSVLQRHNPSIVHVLSIAPYTVIYTFSAAAQTWEKSGIEGTLFVVQLSQDAHKQHRQERYSVVILNRRGLDNLELELHSADDVEITDDYIILQDTDKGVIYGLWVFAEPPPSSTAEMRSVNAKVIQDCAARAEASAAQQGLQGHAQAQAPRQQQQPATSGETATAQSMARQLSIRELFGQQQEAREPLQQPQQQQRYGSNMDQGYGGQYFEGQRSMYSPEHTQQLQQQHQFQHLQQSHQPYPQHHEQQSQPQRGFYNYSPAFRFPPQQNSQYQPQPQPQQPQQPQQQLPSFPQQDVLGDLFQRARQGYNYT